MIGFIVGAIIFSVPTIYYRIKLRKCEHQKELIKENMKMWEWWRE
tara:strand:+ start:362 stop:496 length:135 start_codon:yes stop_codon:yes gene_type:complete